MSNKLLIIGIGGVGKEHIRAANNNHVEELWLQDIDGKVINEFKKGLEEGFVLNKWGSTTEKIKLLDNTKIIQKLEEAPKDITHVVIAVPTAVHYGVVCDVKRLLPNARVLLEKPIAEYKSTRKYIKDQGNVVYVGYNYLFPIRASHNLVVLFNEHTQENTGDISMDLMTHLAYMFMGEGSTLRSGSANDTHAKIQTDQSDLLIVARNQKKHGLFVNGELVDVNYEYLFTKQMEKFLEGENNFAMAYLVENRVEKLCCT